jgi:hypothetical protein
MANLAVTDNFNLCKNNYYYALASENVLNPLPHIPLSHTGIANSGASSFYFAPNGPVPNYNSLAPTIGVRVANGLPKHLVASATLTLASSLPPATMSGHVMPSFPHTLIGLGPFADQGCTIVFTVTTVTVYHPDGHPVFAGWRKQTGPCLWHFPLTKHGATPLAAASITTLLETIPSPLPRAQPPFAGTLRPTPAQSLTLPPALPHPSQGILATNSAGVACAVYYVYRAAQAVALASRATGTPFNPRSLDLPSIGVLPSWFLPCLSWVPSQANLAGCHQSRQL